MLNLQYEKRSLLFGGFAGGLGRGGVEGILVFFLVVDELFFVTIVVSDLTHPDIEALGLGFRRNGDLVSSLK